MLQQGVEIDWLLNYWGGSYLIPYHEVIENECVVRNVKYEVISDVQASRPIVIVFGRTKAASRPVMMSTIGVEFVLSLSRAW